MASCEKEGPATEPARILIAYIGVDNDLNNYETAKLEGLRDGWTGKPTDRIFAYVDKRNGAALYELSVAGSSAPLLLESFGSENSASPATLSRVINTVIADYPADSYGLLVFSHASGWLPPGMLDNPTGAYAPPSKSVITDGTGEMELRGFADAIPEGVFDYIVFEACFMAGIEVAYELRNKAKYILASSAEIVDPGFTPVYSSATAKIMGQDLAGFGQSVFTHTLTYAENNPRRSATYSVIKTDRLEALASFVLTHCDFSKTVDVPSIQRFDRMDNYRLFFDFEDYYGRLLTGDTERSELSRLVAACVTWKKATESFMTQTAGYNGFRIEKHSGLTTYIPQGEFPGLNHAYRSTAWAASVGIIP